MKDPAIWHQAKPQETAGCRVKEKCLNASNATY